MSFLRALAVAATGGDLNSAARLKQLAVISLVFLALAGVIGALAGGFWLINLTAAYATMLALIEAEMRVAMALTGCTGLADIDRSCLAEQAYEPGRV